MHSTLVAFGALALAIPLQQVRTTPSEVLADLAGAVATGSIEQGEPILPLPRSPLTIGASRSNLADLVGQVSELTGVAIRASAPALERLSEAPTGLLTDISIAPVHAWSFFEALVAQEGFILVELRSTAPRLLAIVDTRDGDRDVGARAFRPIDSADLARYAEHHALLVETVLSFEHVDVRQMSSALLSMVSHGSALKLVPAGSSGSIFIQGTGAKVVEVARMLEAVEAETRARVAGIGQQGDTRSPDGTAGG